MAERPSDDFVPAIFWRVLAVALTVLLACWVAGIWWYGHLSTTDLIGSLVCAGLVSYLVHLWIACARNR